MLADKGSVLVTKTWQLRSLLDHILESKASKAISPKLMKDELSQPPQRMWTPLWQRCSRPVLVPHPSALDEDP